MHVKNHIDTEIGRRLRKARLADNLSQNDLAQKLGVSHQQVQKYEDGGNRISATGLWAASRVLGLPITYFFDGLDDSQVAGATDAAEEALPGHTIRVAHMLDEMQDGEAKDKIFLLIRAFSKAR